MKKKDIAELKKNLRSMVRIINGDSTPEQEGASVVRGAGAEPGDPAPAAIRAQLKMTQPQFAELLQIPLRTLQGWEIGRRSPDPAARTLLRVAATAPQILRKLKTA